MQNPSAHGIRKNEQGGEISGRDGCVGIRKGISTSIISRVFLIPPTPPKNPCYNQLKMGKKIRLTCFAFSEPVLFIYYLIFPLAV